MQIYDMIRHDHQMVLEVLDSIESVSDQERRRDLFSFMRTELVMHAKSEEEVFYRPLRDRLPEDAVIDHSFEDHDAIDRMVLDIQTTFDAEAWIGKVRQLRALLAAHMEKEEGPVFQLAERHFTAAEAEAAAIRMMEKKGKLGMENPITALGYKLKELVE